MNSDYYKGIEELGLLFQTDGLLAGDWRCSGTHPVSDERALANEIIFIRQGAFSVETDHAALLADASLVLLLEEGSWYRISHPMGCRDRCLLLALTTRELNDLLASVHPGFAENRRHLFSQARLPCSLDLSVSQHRFLRRVENSRNDPLASAEAALTLLANLFSVLPGPRFKSRDETKAARRDRIEAVRIILHQRIGETMTLADLAASVQCSPFHLARQFRAETGESIHRYRLRLRLQAALQRLHDGEPDLTPLALELGFYDHAHFCSVFRRHFGTTPSMLRRELSARTFRKRYRGV